MEKEFFFLLKLSLSFMHNALPHDSSLYIRTHLYFFFFSFMYIEFGRVHKMGKSLACRMKSQKTERERERNIKKIKKKRYINDFFSHVYVYSFLFRRAIYPFFATTTKKSELHFFHACVSDVTYIFFFFLLFSSFILLFSFLHSISIFQVFFPFFFFSFSLGFLI